MSFSSKKESIYGVFADSDSDGAMDSDIDYNTDSSSEFKSNKRKRNKKGFKKGNKYVKNEEEREVMFVPQSSSTHANNTNAHANEDATEDPAKEESDEVLDAFEDAIKSAASKPVALSNSQFRDFLMQPAAEENSSQQNHESESDPFANELTKAALSAKEKSANLPAVPVHTLGTWEKHTKGIGSKLLQKFGFKGRLGANESGVSKPIEVVVRPNGLGLGFGDFKEATVSKTNREIEAEWRGVPLKPTEEEEEEERRRKGRSGKSNQRSKVDASQSEIEKLAESKSWKKSAGKKQLQTATEILLQQARELERAAGQKQTIIDMRYQDVRVLTDLTKGTRYEGEDDDGETQDPALTRHRPKLGEDFLSRVNHVADLVQIEYASARRKLTNEDLVSSSAAGLATGALGLAQQIQQIDRQLQALESSQSGQESKAERLSNLLEVINRVESKHSDPATCASVQVKDVLKMLSTIEQKFPEEFSLFGLINLVPTLLRPILVSKLSSTGAHAWRALDDPAALFSVVDSWHEGLDTWKAASVSAGRSQETNELLSQCTYYFSSLMEEILVPALRRCVTNDWHDVYSTEGVVGLFTTARALISAAQFDQLVDMVLLPKLQQSADQWTPSSALPPIHRLLLPWLPLLKDKLARFYPEIRRKLNHYLHHWNGRDPKPLQMLLPWKNVFDESSMQNLILRAIVPKLVTALQQMTINPSSQDTSAVESALSWAPLLSDIHFGGLFLGEFFPKWLHALAIWLCSPAADLEEISEWYGGWKLMFESLLATAGESGKMAILEKPFTAALGMMSAILDNGEIYQSYADSHGVDGAVTSLLERVGCAGMSSMSFASYVEAQQTDARVKERLRELSGGSVSGSTTVNSRSTIDRSKRNVTGGLMSVSFKEVVETFAERSGVPFHPKHGSSHLAEGKQLYQFGSLLCYIDQNVLFVQSGERASGNGSRAWRPVDLEEALVMAQKA